METQPRISVGICYSSNPFAIVQSRLTLDLRYDVNNDQIRGFLTVVSCLRMVYAWSSSLSDRAFATFQSTEMWVHYNLT